MWNSFLGCSKSVFQCNSQERQLECRRSPSFRPVSMPQRLRLCWTIPFAINKDKHRQSLKCETHWIVSEIRSASPAGRKKDGPVLFARRPKANQIQAPFRQACLRASAGYWGQLYYTAVFYTCIIQYITFFTPNQSECMYRTRYWTQKYVGNSPIFYGYTCNQLVMSDNLWKWGIWARGMQDKSLLHRVEKFKNFRAATWFFDLRYYSLSSQLYPRGK